MKKNLLAWVLLLAISPAFSQIGYEGAPAVWADKHIPSDIPFVQTPSIDLNQLASEDAVTDQYKEAPYRFGVEHAVAYNTSNAGVWRIDNATQTAVWQMGIECAGALNISVRFSEFKMPKGGEVYIWSADRSQFIGGFNYKSNANGGSFATGLVHGDKVVVEMKMPVSQMGNFQLAIDQIVHGYRSFLKTHFQQEEEADRGPFGSSGSCNINVNCPEGDDWQIEKRSVAIIVEGGFGLCTGAMVNNTANDGTPYFLTANHCTQGSNVGNWTFYFNHESATCGGTSAPTTQSISGSTLKANSAWSDFALLLLDETPPTSYNVQYAGWDASDNENAVTSATCIHHPSGDIKKITHEEDAPYFDIGNGAQVWWIDNWEAGITEPGSSGSPLFDQNHRIIGQLFGGASACNGSSGNGLYDFYGRFGQSWDHNSASSAQLMFWLDPNGTGTTVLDGYPDGFVAAQLDASVGNITGVPATLCGSGFNASFTLSNNGISTLTSCTITYQLNGGAAQTINWTGSLAQGGTEIIYLPGMSAANGNNTLTVSVSNANNATDENANNNSVSVSFSAITGTAYAITLGIMTDDYPDETTWTIELNGNELYSGGPYSAGNEYLTESLCLAPGCYTFTIFDDYDDGICCDYGNGYWEILNQNNVQYGTGGEFTTSETLDFCVDANGVVEFDALTHQVYPNPSNETVTITNTREVESIVITDISGRVVRSANNNNSAITIMDTKTLANGTYIISVIKNGEVSATRIVVQH